MKSLQCVWIQPYYYGWNIKYRKFPAHMKHNRYLDEEGFFLYCEENVMHPILAMQSLHKQLKGFKDDMFKTYVHVVSNLRHTKKLIGCDLLEEKQ